MEIPNLLAAAIEHAGAYDELGRDIAIRSRNGFISGAEWAITQQTARLHAALKQLHLDKHPTALNVLKVAGIELPKNK